MQFVNKKQKFLFFTGFVVFVYVIMFPLKFPSTTWAVNLKYATNSAPGAAYNLSSSSNHEKSGCSLWTYSLSRIQYIKPRIQLDPSRFLYPGMINGPNNQILGLRESVYLAIRLNRTFVIPYFWTHYRNKKSDIPPHQVIDVERLCRFASCISIPMFREVCDGAFDVLLEAKKIKMQDVVRVEHYTGMDILKIKKNLNPIEKATKLKILDSNLTSTLPVLFHKSTISASASALLEAYDTPAPCALFAQAYKTIRVSLKDKAVFPLDTSAIDIPSVPSDVLYSAVTDSVRHPPCIMKAAQAYIREVLQGKEYIAVHWRFNKDDWGLLCSDPRFPHRTRICKEVFDITPRDIAQGVLSRLSDDQQLGTDGNITFVHIATPPSITYFKEDFYNELKTSNKNIRTAEQDLENFLVKKYKSCWDSTGWHAIAELVSLVEMVIMEQSSWFFYSRVSSWSDNVVSFRTERLSDGSVRSKYSKSVYEIALSAMKRRRLKQNLWIKLSTNP